MGLYTEYLNSMTDYSKLEVERRAQLKRISEIRQRAAVVIAADLGGRPNKANAAIGIDYTDLLPIADRLEELTGDGIDVILETPGGLAERAEDIVRMLRAKFKSVAFIVPGAAMSAGTIMVMSGDEILMDSNSSLGPIDAQMAFGFGKRFSAEAFLTGLEAIKKEVEQTGVLNKAYIPILQNISPAEIQHCQNSLNFAKTLVTEWLATWKFLHWDKHASTGLPVTEADKHARAAEIADELCKHSQWLTHSRGFKLVDLERMRLKITDFSKLQDLDDAIRRYYTLMQMTFDGTAIYKYFETPNTVIARFVAQAIQAQAPSPTLPAVTPSQANIANAQFTCPNCAATALIQANLDTPQPLQLGHVAFPADNRFKCPKCGLLTDLTQTRQAIEAQTKKKVVT
jgi:predicted RNA-binding Zn-ribbon protein involved in translation (DUF1610 family)